MAGGISGRIHLRKLDHLTRKSGTKTQPILLVTGLSGAGKTTVLKTLEDLGWEAVDNFPIRLAGPLLDIPAPTGRSGSAIPLALAVPGLTGGARLRAALAYAAGGMAALAVLAGPWLALMFREFGNPVFPLMNGWFQSPHAPAINLVGERFAFQGFADAIADAVSAAAEHIERARGTASGKGYLAPGTACVVDRLFDDVADRLYCRRPLLFVEQIGAHRSPVSNNRKPETVSDPLTR